MEYTFSVIGSDQQVVDQLKTLIGAFPDFRCVFATEGYEESLDSLLKKVPSLVFVDLDRKGELKNPFCLVNELHQYLEELPHLVGLSTCKEKAYEAIKSQFFDFLLRPLSEFEMRKCLMKFQKTGKRTNSEKLCLKSYSDYKFITFEEILYLKADNNTTDFYLTQGRKVSAFKTLKHFEDSLPGGFLRVHNSYIINSRQVTRINYGRSLIALQGLSPGVPFSKSYKAQVDNLKENLITSLSIVS